MDLSCRLRCFCPFFDRPSTNFRLSRGQIADQPEEAVTCLDQFLQPGFLKSQVLQKHLLLILFQFCDLLLDLRTNHKHFTVFICRIFTHALYPCIRSAVIREIILFHICRKNNRFVSQEIVALQPCLLVLILNSVKCLSKLSFLQMRLDPLHKGKLLRDHLVISCSTNCFRNSSFQYFQIREDQFQIDRLDIPERVNTSVYMNDIAVLKTSYHMNDRIHLPDICKELISKPLSFGCPLYQTRNIHKFNCCRNNLFCVVHFPEDIQTLVRNGYNTNVRVNRAERIVRRLGTSFGQ